jgi:hypothetical protein
MPARRNLNFSPRYRFKLGRACGYFRLFRKKPCAGSAGCVFADEDLPQRTRRDAEVRQRETTKALRTRRKKAKVGSGLHACSLLLSSLCTWCLRALVVPASSSSPPTSSPSAVNLRRLLAKRKTPCLSCLGQGVSFFPSHSGRLRSRLANTRMCCHTWFSGGGGDL